MKWDDVGSLNCSMARALALVGDRWTLLILRNAFLGTRRFDDFQTQLGITRQVLTERLKRLVEHRILRRDAYQPRRYEYRLTDKGLALYPVLLSLSSWGDQWLDEEGRGAPFLYKHTTCGKTMLPTMVCNECGEPLNARTVALTPGPGFRQAKPASTPLGNDLADGA